MKKRVVVIGAGLCGSVVSTLLRDDFQVTVVEQGRKKRPLFDDVDCATGELNTSINRAEGLGGTTNYWHNALIELDDSDLAKAGIEPRGMQPYYAKAWSFFLSKAELEECERARAANRASLEHGVSTVAHMVLPQTRHNAWHLANARHPGAEIDVVYGHARKSSRRRRGARVRRGHGAPRQRADRRGLRARVRRRVATPVLLASSLGQDDGFCAGYHDHPMAYVAKVKLRSDSRLKAVSCTTTRSAEVRAGLVYETAGLKTVVYLRPAVDLRLGSITGPARYILSDLRNESVLAQEILLLLGNLEAVREAILFKTGLGFRGDYYSVLILGEQTPIKTRGIQLTPGERPALDWHVTADELSSYDHSVDKFFAEFAADIVERKALRAASWAFRNAARHSGTANQFVAAPGDTSLAFFAATGLPGAYVCDASLLRAAGIANSGLTLVALGYRLAELLRATA